MADAAPTASAPASAPSAPAVPAKTPAAAPTIKRARPDELSALSQQPEPTFDPDAPSPFASDDDLPSGRPELEGEPSLETEPEPLDEPHADDLGEDAPVFGMEPSAFVESIRKGEIPQGMLDVLHMDVPVVRPDGSTGTDRILMKDLPEYVRRGVLRQADYTRKTQEVAHIKGQAEQVIRSYQQEQQLVTSPQGFRQWVEAGGQARASAFYDAAHELAKEVSAYRAMSPEQQAAYDERQALQYERAQTQRERDEINQQRAAQQHDQRRQKHAQDLATMMPAAFQRLQIQESKLSQQLFQQHLLAAVNAADDFSAGLTQQIVDDAAQATLESLHEMARYGAPAPAAAAQAATNQQQARRLPGAPPPTALPGARVPGSPPPRQGFRGSIGNFTQELAKLNGR